MADHVSALLARRVGRSPGELSPIAEDLLAFAFTAPQVIKDLHSDLMQIPIPQDLLVKKPGGYQPPTVLSLRFALQELARGMQYAYEEVHALAAEHTRDPLLGPLELTDDIIIVPMKALEDSTNSAMWYLHGENNIEITTPFLRIISTLIANPGLSFTFDSQFGNLGTPQEQSVRIPLKAMIILAGMEEVYHSYQHTEVFRLIQGMAKASGVYDEATHDMLILRDLDTPEAIALAQSLISSSPEAAQLYDAYYDPAIKRLIEADIALHAIVPSNSRYHELNPFEVEATRFKYEMAKEYGFIPGLGTHGRIILSA